MSKESIFGFSYDRMENSLNMTAKATQEIIGLCL
jgi:hypothetical protein